MSELVPPDRHRELTDILQANPDIDAVLSGRAKLVMYDLREGSPTRGELQEELEAEQRPARLRRPEGEGADHELEEEEQQRKPRPRPEPRVQPEPDRPADHHRGQPHERRRETETKWGFQTAE